MLSEALNLEAAMLGVWLALWLGCALWLGVHSVCARYMAGARAGARGWWSQVVSGVVTLGCLSPRPRLCAPVGACSPVQACVCACVRLCACAGVCAFCVGGVCVLCRFCVGGVLACGAVV